MNTLVMRKGWGKVKFDSAKTRATLTSRGQGEAENASDFRQFVRPGHVYLAEGDEEGANSDYLEEESHACCSTCGDFRFVVQFFVLRGDTPCECVERAAGRAAIIDAERLCTAPVIRGANSAATRPTNLDL